MQCFSLYQASIAGGLVLSVPGSLSVSAVVPVMAALREAMLVLPVLRGSTGKHTHTHVHSAAVTHLSLCINDVLMPHSPPVSARSPVLEHGRRVRCALPVPLELRVLRRETRRELSVIVSGARHVARDGNRCVKILQGVSVCDKQQRNTDATRDVQRLFHSVAASPKVPAN